MDSGQEMTGIDQSSEIELSILMPCLNEAQTLGGCIREACTFLELSGVKGEVLVADNGSTDGSIEIAMELGARVVQVPIRGYGAALYFGSIAARGKYIIMADSDGSYDLENLGGFLRELRAGNELVMGNRFRGGIMRGAMPWKNRYIGNPILSFIGQLLFGSKIGDFHCGIRGYSKTAFMKLDLRTTGMEFASEMVIKAQLMELRICEIPCILRPDGRLRPPHLRPWRDGWRHLRFMLLFSPCWLFVYPGILVALLAGAVTSFLWGSPYAQGHPMQMPGILFSCILTLAGIQSSIFGGFLLVYSIVEGFRPQKASFTRIFKYLNLEVGVTVGLAFLLAGSVLTISKLWTQALDTRVLCETIPTAMVALLGLQVILSSFFFSVLGIGLRRAPHPFEELNNRQENSSNQTSRGRISGSNVSHGDDPHIYGV